VSWIQSNYTGFGAGMVPEGWGFSLQNRGCLFALDPDHANCFAPGKRPFHTIIPAMMTRAGEPVLSFGLMGGAMQPQGHVQIVSHLLDHGMNVQEAGDAPRWRHEGSSEPTGEVMVDGGVVHLETGVPGEIVTGLRERGHTVQVGPGGFGGYQAIGIADHAGPNRLYRGASECRKDGQAIGL
jgi:gamma-glutamyltranspeptidase/glutathione hydrolase